MKKTTVFALMAMMGILGYAQDTGESKLGMWLEATASNRISEKLSLTASYTDWEYNGFSDYQLHLGQVGLSYKLNPKTAVGTGYGYGSIETVFESNGAPAIKEHRLYEMVSYSHKSNTISWSHRFKLEHRFLERPTEDVLIHRIRYRFKGDLPLNDAFFVSVYDEIHFNLNAFDFQQNRAFGGLGYKFNNNINVIAGYARHSFKTKSFNRVSLQLNLKFDLRKDAGQTKT